MFCKVGNRVGCQTLGGYQPIIRVYAWYMVIKSEKILGIFMKIGLLRTFLRWKVPFSDVLGRFLQKFANNSHLTFHNPLSILSQICTR